MTTLSFEFFPTKTTEGTSKLMAVRDELANTNPAFFSVTYGAGGSTQDRTLSIVEAIQQAGVEAAPHLTCVGADRSALRDLLTIYREMGIRRIVALRGDLPSGAGLASGELRHASDLIEFIRAETGDWFELEVGAYPEKHPQADSYDRDIEHFVNKIKAGANSAITQYFFNPDSYFHFVDKVRAKGIDAPIVPGIMPITNYSKLARFSDACGAEIPRWMRQQLADYGDDVDSIKAFGTEVIARMCQQLLDGGAPGLHFYTLNQAEASLDVLGKLGMEQAEL